MYVIMVYDVGVDRVGATLKIARRYLTWVQNSVSEGEITEANFMRLKKEIGEVIEGGDSIMFYILRTTDYMRKEALGVVKGEPRTII